MRRQKDIINIWNVIAIKHNRKVFIGLYGNLEKKTKKKNPWTESENKLFKQALKSC